MTSTRQMRFTLLALAALLACAATFGQSPAPAGQFWRVHWFEKGVEHGNPIFTNRFRVNAPEAVLGRFKDRTETQSSGMLQILAREDLSLLAAAELYVELWGGHPGTAHKRVSLNGRGQYAIPEVGTAAKHCTHQYPTIPLKLTDLVNGYNAVQFACDQGQSFWGHFIVENAALRVALKAEHPDLQKAGLAGFTAAVRAQTGAGDETINLSLDVPAGMLPLISSVEYQGWYAGYDENGDGHTADWHGFTKARQPTAVIGTATAAPFGLTWDTTMLPDQAEVGVRAVVRFKDQANLIYAAPPLMNVKLSRGQAARVALYHSKDQPDEFWSRAGRLKTATIELDVDPAEVERAELHVVAWDGGAGNVKDYFKLNGQPLVVANAGKHDVIYSRVALDPKLLKKGANRIELLSDTEHHGIEVLLPGPALMIRRK